MKKKTWISTFAILAAAGLLLWSSQSTPTRAKVSGPPVVLFSDEMPEAWGKFELVKVDTIALLVDATKEQVLRDVPIVALVGDTVKISCKQQYFAVTPTIKGKGVPMEVRPAGDVIELKKDGPYTVILFKIENGTPKAEAVSYVLKATEKNLKRLLEEIDRRIQEEQEVFRDPDMTL